LDSEAVADSQTLAAAQQRQRFRRLTTMGVLLFVLIAVASLTWAKWWPYAHKLSQVVATSSYPGKSILASAGRAEASPSVAGAWRFTVAYAESVWIALVAALVIAAAIEALLPRRLLVRAVAGRRGKWQTMRGGAAALPSMMCTCCTAPLTDTLRREGVPTSSALAYWIGNPTLNPAVLAFLLIVAPWQWALTRALVGGLLVFVLTAVVARLSDRSPPPKLREPADAEQHLALATAPARFGKSLLRLTVTLIPEYLGAVFVIGLLRGWLFPFDASGAHWGVLAVIAAAVVGTLIVIPTAGEIPILQGLQALGVGSGVVGALLITLPAISLPSIAMASRALKWRVTMAMAVAVAATGLLAGALLWGLTG
jgi:uncharacterized protein